MILISLLLNLEKKLAACYTRFFSGSYFTWHWQAAFPFQPASFTRMQQWLQDNPAGLFHPQGRKAQRGDSYMHGHI
jgi:hypothetical protein